MMFHKMPLILLLMILAVLGLNSFIPLEIKQILYAVSLTIKSGIIFILPLIIFGLLFKTMVSLAQRATWIIGLVIICVCCSNAFSTFLSHFVGAWIYQFDLSLVLPQDGSSLLPAWSWQLPKLIANDKAMFAGVGLGILMARLAPNVAVPIAENLDKLISALLNYFVYFIPVFVLGFVVKMQFDGVMATIIKDYGIIFVMIGLAQFSYIFLAYIVLSHLRPRLGWQRVKNMLPAALTGFSTMSSAAAMPLTMAGAERNSDNKDLAKAVIPATVNIHLVGDCFAIPILAYAVMKSFGVPAPDIATYMIFVFYFVIAKFSVAAIPGGGIMVMLPILESHLGFNSSMLSMITALYILFDPVITSANVLGNGAFACLIDKLSTATQRVRRYFFAQEAEVNS
jgi:Na+/H+-dicarboxylate symporter